jgi:hypothetical protein
MGELRGATNRRHVSRFGRIRGSTIVFVSMHFFGFSDFVCYFIGFLDKKDPSFCVLCFPSREAHHVKSAYVLHNYA